MHGRPWPLEDAEYDVVIVGGGMAGAGVARELALRGLSVALVEKGDFASATTSQSSKLIHGGLRYLELFDFGLVRESLRERERLLRSHPHLVRRRKFVLALHETNGMRSALAIRAGLFLYGKIAHLRRREFLANSLEDSLCANEKRREAKRRPEGSGLERWNRVLRYG